jgi:hypothetical protein
MKMTAQTVRSFRSEGLRGFRWAAMISWYAIESPKASWGLWGLEIEGEDG